MSLAFYAALTAGGLLIVAWALLTARRRVPADQLVQYDAEVRHGATWKFGLIAVGMILWVVYFTWLSTQLEWPAQCQGNGRGAFLIELLCSPYLVSRGPSAIAAFASIWVPLIALFVAARIIAVRIRNSTQTDISE